MSDRSLKGSLALVATALLAVVALGSFAGSRAVADDLGVRSEAALTAAGLGDVDVEFHGREAEVSGGNDVEARVATSLVSALPGVRQVAATDIEQVRLAGVARFELDRAGDDVEISGTVASPDDAAAIKVGVAASLRTMIAGDVVVDPTVGAAPWVPALPAVLDLVAGVEGLEVEIPGDGTVHLGGEVADAESRTRLVRLVAAELPYLEVVDTLGVVVPSSEGS